MLEVMSEEDGFCTEVYIGGGFFLTFFFAAVGYIGGFLWTFFTVVVFLPTKTRYFIL